MTEPRGRLALTGGCLILPDCLLHGMALVVEAGRIAGIATPGELGTQTELLDVGGRYVAPGLIDIHTHGARGHTFNEASAEAFASLLSAL